MNLDSIFDELDSKINSEDLEAFIISLDYKLIEVYGCYERVYKKELPGNAHIIIYTTISLDGFIRKSGSDAIRILLMRDNKTCIKKAKRVNRRGELVSICDRIELRTNELESHYFKCVYGEK